MITLHILKLLEDNDLGTLALTGNETADQPLFFEKLPQGKTGIAIYSRGAALSRGQRTTQAFDLYSRGKNDVAGHQALEAIISFIDENYGETCTLPVVPGVSDAVYTNVTIEPISNIENAGVDANERVVYTMTAQVTYNKN